MGNLILLCNARGKVGQELVKLLESRQAEYRAAVGDVEAAKLALGESIPLVHLKYSQAETFAPALEGVKRVFLLHPLYEVTEGDIESFVDAAKAAGVEQIVFMSALGANLQANDPICKLEQHIIKSGIAYTILRPNWFMQNFNTADLPRINKKNEIMQPSGEHKLSFIDTRDIANAAAEILLNGGHEGKEYTLTGDETFSYGEVAALISAEAGRTIEHQSPDYQELLEKMREHGAPEDGINMMRWLFEDILRDYAAGISNDYQAITGQAPRKLADYIKEYADVWRV